MVDYLEQLITSTSSERLEAYRPSNGDNKDMIETYLWNIGLSEALYPTLQAVEIALRNNIYAAGVRFYGDSMWFANPSVLTLQSLQRQQLDSARRDLERAGKSVTVGRLIAELGFGFWTSLFNRPYERHLWAPPNLELLSMVFPNVSRSFRSRNKIAKRLNDIRRLRNRVFHHEPVWNLGMPNLKTRHSQVVETIGWLSMAVKETTQLIDRFDTVHSRENSPYRDEIARLLARA